MDEIKGIARVKFHPGKVEEWKRLTEEAMEIVRTRDTGTLQYEIFFNEDETEATVHAVDGVAGLGIGGIARTLSDFTDVLLLDDFVVASMASKPSIRQHRRERTYASSVTVSAPSGDG